jgi:hypothetical protein
VYVCVRVRVRVRACVCVYVSKGNFAVKILKILGATLQNLVAIEEQSI